MKSKKLFTKIDPTDGKVYGDYADHEHDSALAHEMLPDLRFASEIMDFILAQRSSDFPLCCMAQSFKLRSAPFLDTEGD